MNTKLGNFESVEQFEDNNGPIKNQFKIATDKGVIFQSYDSIIAARLFGQKIMLDKDKWDYSIATGKYRNQFLDEKKADTEKKIKSGEYILTDLN